MTRLSRTCARIADSTAFNVAIFAVIVVNAAVLGLETYDSIERDAGGALGLLNDLFLGIFVVELAVRIAAHGRRPHDFFRSGWNLFDFVVIAAAFVPGLRENSTLLRLARLARVIRVVRILPDLRLLVSAVGKSLPGVASLGVMTVLLLYVYGMIGWLAFGDRQPADFGDIGNAMLTLFVLLSLENLPAVIADARAISGWAVLFYISYVLLAAFLVLNLLIGVVISSLERAKEAEWQREQKRRRAEALATPEPEDDRAVTIEQRIHDLRNALDDLERQLHAGEWGPPRGPMRHGAHG